MDEKKKNYDMTERASQLSQEETTQELRWQESDGHSGQGARQPVDKPHYDDLGNNKLSTSLDEDSAL
ncbi:hypothetical protein EPD60_00805 [Flaviaesturariibacter flavus]|uniref:Uncharacterized protein n=1 Tax=Flaviaesturariibacter flavus TaxID=2502780 RepID=A0A4R1BP12_9BACT|nr:hypothetical protein [Flaviaesturariibacter flavus]TCJ18985.1 hypothetical protein EPD60_00805 [Flaviaesturariibacter flavus]